MIPTQEERKTIRARYTEKFPQGYQYSQARVDVLMLLDALDEAEEQETAYLRSLGDGWREEYDKLQADRDHWKARTVEAEAKYEEVAMEYSRLADGLYTAHKAKEYLAERNHWKARAEALERAIKSGIAQRSYIERRVAIPCSMCTHYSNDIGCNQKCGDSSNPYTEWHFNIERFADKEGDGQE